MKLCLLLMVWQVPLLQAPVQDVEVVAFFGVDCPLARLYARRLNELRAEFPTVRFRACAPNRHDDLAKVAAFQSALEFPIEKNAAEARRLGATCSPEVFLIRAGRVEYSGRIDDQYTPGRRRTAPTRRDLAFAIEEILQGQAVTVPRVEPEGCRLSLDAPATGSATDALAIVHARCAVCHHPETAAPFSLLSSEDVRDWRETIRDVITQGRMPPWGATRGEFANDRRLSTAERQVLLDWIEAGCPDGEGVKAPEFPAGWSFPPDVVQEAPPFEVPASGTLEYREFRLPVFERDTWVRAIEMRGSRAVHHINALLEPPQADPRVRYAVDGDDYLATMVAGNPGIELPAGTAKLIPRGWRIKLEIHYEPTGQSLVDHSAIALKLADGPCRRVITRTLLNDDIVLPPNSLATFEQAWQLDRNYTLLAIFPHMHLRGKSMRVEVCAPHGAPEVLIDVPRYDYGWQDRYVLASPRELPAGALIRVTAQFDNTRNNPVNPDPSQTVRAGKRAVDEMFQCTLDLCEAPPSVKPFSPWLALVAIGAALVYTRVNRHARPTPASELSNKV